MSEKIYSRLLRLYPSSFRKEYEAESLQLIRDRFRDETGFFKRARLWWDLVVDAAAWLPSAYRNSYSITEPASVSFNAVSIPSFKILDEKPLGRGSILVGSTISLCALVAFASLLARPIEYPQFPGSNGRLSPIESVMQHLDQAQALDSNAGSIPDAAALGLAQMSGSQAQPSKSGRSTPSTSASSTETGISSSVQDRVVSTQMENLNQHPLNGLAANMQNSANDSQTVAQQSTKYTGTIEKATPRVALSYVPANLASGSIVHLTATVLALGTWPTPTGNVRFFDGSDVLGMGKLNNGTVTVKAKLPNVATHFLSAIYYGDANYSAARSVRERE
jgi:hypothetical protein